MTRFTGAGRLVRLALRRDRIQLPVWILALVALLEVNATSTLGLYPTDEERIALAVSSARSPVALISNSLVSGASRGATVMTQALLVGCVGAALMSTFAVVRHTRQEEETGRAELVGAGVVGRLAGLGAAMLVVVAANIALGLLSALTLMANALPATGSFGSGAALAAVGITFAAVAAVAAQISGSSRGANGLAGAAIGLAFVLRAVGAVAGHTVDGGTRVVPAWPVWLSPLGWAELVRPYDRDEWWVFGLFAMAVVVLLAVALVLVTHRDVGAGLRPVGPGPAVADRRLLHPIGLAWRLQRGALLAWAVAIALLGAAYGGVGNEVEELIGTSDQAADLIEALGGGGSLTDAYFATILGFGGVAVAAYAVQATLRLHSEETSGRVEALLATGVSRTRWMWSHIAVAAVGTIGLLAILGLATGLTFGLVAGDLGGHVAELVPAALVRAPAALAVAGLAAAIFGVLPRLAVALSWAAVALFLVLGLLGPALDVPQLLMDVSPFTHVPAAPAVAARAQPLVALCGAAALLVAAGLAAFRRRDVALG